MRTFLRPGIIAAWDNTTHYVIGENEAGQETMMQPFILSNKGAEGDTDLSREEFKHGQMTTCDPQFLREFGVELGKTLKDAGLPDEIAYNLVYKGGYIAEHYNTRRHPEHFESGVQETVQSFQLEYDTILTHPDQDPKHPDREAMTKLRVAVERALYRTYTNLLTRPIGLPELPEHLQPPPVKLRQRNASGIS